MPDKVDTMISLCRQIDECARDAYATLSSVSTDPELKVFWNRMSMEEGRHIEFWRALQKSDLTNGIARLVTDSSRTIQELESALEKSRELVDKTKEIPPLKEAFLLAYRMEFNLLHPAFELFFTFLQPDCDIVSPESEYDVHIEHFSKTLKKFGGLSPELELLADTLQQLWRDNRRLAHTAAHDILTGLFNRRGFLAVTAQMALLSERENSRAGVIMVDLDDFKGINDQFGHAQGDEALRSVSKIMTERLRKSDILGRYGGEEFVVWVHSVKEGATVALAESLRAAVEEETKQSALPITISVGVTEAPISGDPEQCRDSMIARADTAMYEAKLKGKNSVVEQN